jgi:cytochrome c556
MASLAPAVLRRFQRAAMSIVSAALVAVGADLTASGQEQSETIAKDAIFARKILMDTIGTNMDELETMTTSDKGVNLTEGHEHADNISIMLMAFPHLFPPNTNRWKPNVERDPGRDTYAAPGLWQSYSDFYAQAARASKIAYNASRAQQEADFKKFVAELRLACDSCHAVYLKTDQ